LLPKLFIHIIPRKMKMENVKKHLGTAAVIAAAIVVGLFIHSWASNKMADRKAATLTPSPAGEEA